MKGVPHDVSIEIGKDGPRAGAGTGVGAHSSELRRSRHADTASPAASTEAPPAAHPCDDAEADSADDYCSVGDQWYANTDGQWAETDQGPPTPDATTSDTVAEETPTTTAAMEAEVVSIAGVEVVVDEELIPEPEVVEEVSEAVAEAAPESELTLQDCTEWANAGFGGDLDDAQKAQCIAMIAAAVTTCEELECFPTTTSEAPTTTEPPTPTTTEPPTPTTTQAPTPTTTEPPVPTTTQAPTPTTTQAPTPTTTEPPVVEAPYSVGRPDDNPPEGGHPPTPQIGMIPRDLPYWDHPNCAAEPPWNSGCYPPSEWELPPDLDDCRSPSPDGRVCPGRRPDETPRLTEDVARWTSWCYNLPSTPCRQMLFKMKWALDFLGAHPWCVLNQYADKANVYASPQQPPRNINELYGWHNCATVIDPTVGTPDPGRDNDDGVLLSHSGISLAEQCRRVLPPDIALEHSPRRFTDEVQRFDPGHAGCDAWAAWVNDRRGAKDFRACDRSARLASEWMEHHYNLPAATYTVTC